MSSHLRRVLIAAVALPALFLIIRNAPAPAFFVLVAAVILAGQYEFYRFHYSPDRWTYIAAGLAFGFLLAFGLYLGRSVDGPPPDLLVFSGVVAGLLLTGLAAARDLSKALADSAILLLGVLYVSLLLSHLLFLRGLPGGQWLVLFVLGATWLVDAGAYYIGTWLGRRRLAPTISPRKTIEGAIGGLAAGAAGGVAAKLWLLGGLSLWDAVRLGLVIGVAAQLGDLVESLWKRSAGVKDSGALLGAHGGILDKIDSVMFTAPVFYYYLVYVLEYAGMDQVS